MSSQNPIFEKKIPLPDDILSSRQKTLLGFNERYTKIHDQLRLLLNLNELSAWSKKYYGHQLPLCSLVTEQYPLVIFYGDVGTGKTVTAECIANQMVIESRTEDSILYKLSNRVRGSGKVGEMGTLLTQAFHEVVQSAGKNRRAILLIDEGDSIAASRSQEHSHHEDKVAVNTLIQCIDELRQYGGRIVVFFCTNRLSILDAALKRRAAILESFERPNTKEILELLNMDLKGLALTSSQLTELAKKLSSNGHLPGFTYSDIRTRLYPAVLAKAFPNNKITVQHINEAILSIQPSPIQEDK